MDPDLTNFKSVGHAMIAMFQVLVENNWNDILYSTAAGVGLPAVLFFVLYYIVVVYFFLNIFTAIVLGSFTKQTDANTASTLPGWMTFYITLPNATCVKLRRRDHHAQSALELHMDLMDSTKAELLRECVEEHVFLDVLEDTCCD